MSDSARRSKGEWLRDPMSVGKGPVVTVAGTPPCGRCGTVIHVSFCGPDDSMGVRLARTSLADPLCDRCIDAATAQDERAEAEAQAVERIRGRVERAGLPDRWRTLAFEEMQVIPEQAVAIELARSWASGDIRGVALHGEVGVGKTLIAAAATVLRCALSPAKWIGVAALLMDLRMPFDAPEYARAVRRLAPGGRGAALVLDDLDKLRPTEHQLQPLYVAVNAWIEAGQPLFVTLNRSLDGLASWGGDTFGAALASRLAGYCDVVEVVGKDRRLG